MLDSAERRRLAMECLLAAHQLEDVADVLLNGSPVMTVLVKFKEPLNALNALAKAIPQEAAD